MAPCLLTGRDIADQAHACGAGDGEDDLGVTLHDEGDEEASPDNGGRLEKMRRGAEGAAAAAAILAEQQGVDGRAEGCGGGRQ